jgi:hypothetical protein
MQVTAFEANFSPAKCGGFVLILLSSENLQYKRISNIMGKAELLACAAQADNQVRP